MALKQVHAGNFQRGQRHPGARFTDLEVHEMRERHRNGESINSIARSLGSGSGYISLIINGKRRKQDAEPVQVTREKCSESHTLGDLAMMLGLTIEQVKEIEDRAMAKIRVAVLEQARRAGCTPMQWMFGSE